MKVLVCGGRNFIGEAARGIIRSKLNDLLELHPALVVIQGGSKGAEAIAHEWCIDRSVPQMTMRPDVKRRSGIRAAWHIRNQEVLNWAEPALVLAFPGSLGTKAIVDRAIKHGVPVRKVDW